MNAWVYILESQRHSWYYVGCTTNLEKRLNLHNTKRVRSTKAHAPLLLIWSKEFASLGAARQYETFLKTPKGYLVKKNHILQREMD